MRGMKRLIPAAGALVSMTGCALMTIRGPEDTSGRTRPVCTTSHRAAQLDIGAGTATGLVGIVAGIKVADDHEPLGNSILVAGLLAIAGFYASASIGYVRTKRCKEAIGEYNFRAPDPIETDDDATDN